MTVIALSLAAVALAAAVLVRRKRSRRSVPLAPRLHRAPAGLKHLAAEVSDLSDRGLHLAPARRGATGSKARLGALVDLQ